MSGWNFFFRQSPAENLGPPFVQLVFPILWPKQTTDWVKKHLEARSTFFVPTDDAFTPKCVAKRPSKSMFEKRSFNMGLLFVQVATYYVSLS